MVLQNGVEGIDRILSLDTIRCTILEREETSSYVDKGSDPKARNSCFPYGMVIDDACAGEWLTESVQTTRKDLPLNHKRPTVDRRFYCDNTREVICGPIEKIVRHALELTGCLTGDDDENPPFVVYCNKYLRFLEYKTVGGELLPHRDGTKTCEDTGIKSTHTLLLFLSDCQVGGETLIMDDSGEKGNSNWSKEKNLVLDVYETSDETIDSSNDDRDLNAKKIFNKRRIRYTIDDNKEDIGESATRGSKTKAFRLLDASIRSTSSIGDGEEENDKEGKQPPPRHVSVGIQPSEGRMLIFPHHWPHAGAMCKSVPKIALRAEVTIARAS